MFLVYVPTVDWLEFFGIAFWRWKWGMTSYLAGKWYWFWEVTTMVETNHWATVCMRASYQLWEILEAVLLVSKLRSYVLCRLRWRRMKSRAFLLHDGSYGCSYLIVWLVGEFISLLFTLYWYLHFQEVYFCPSGTVHTWKDFRHNALGPFGHSHFANSVLWRRLSSTARKSVCNIDCGRRQGVWKYPYPVDAIHNTMSKWSLGFYTLLSMVEGILSASGCVCANEAHHEKAYREMYSFLRMVDFQVDWSGLVSATFSTGRFATEWYIRIWIWFENQTLWLKCHSLSLTLYTAITFRDDVVPYYGACRSISRTLTICRQWSRWLTFIAVMVGNSKDHLWEMTLDTNSTAIGTSGLDRVFLYLAFLHYVVVWPFQRYIPHWCCWRPVMQSRISALHCILWSWNYFGQVRCYWRSNFMLEGVLWKFCEPEQLCIEQL